MKRGLKYLFILSTSALLLFSTTTGSAQDTNYIFNVDDPLTGENANIGGFLFPVIFGTTAFGAFEPGASPEDFAFSGHDPQREAGIQTVEASVFLELNKLTGRFTGFGQQGADEWTAELEEAFLRYSLTPGVTVGGGQFLNFFGFQSHRHLHGWDYVNNNLANSRMINEGELVTQGGHLVFKNSAPGSRFAMLTIGAGGVRAHAHEEEHGGHGDEEEEHHDEDEDEHHDEDEDEHHEDEEEHHLEADGANFNDWVATADLKWAMNDDGSALGTASFGVGENGFGETTYLYGFGVQKVWGGRDSGRGYKDLAPGAFMVRSEFIGRSFNAVDEGDVVTFGDQGMSTSLFYGLNESTKLSVRHDWVTGIDELELSDFHRISPAVTTRLGANKRFQTRVQYDYNDSDGLSEHVGWLQLQYQWGRKVGGYYRQ